MGHQLILLHLAQLPSTEPPMNPVDQFAPQVKSLTLCYQTIYWDFVKRFSKVQLNDINGFVRVEELRTYL